MSDKEIWDMVKCSDIICRMASALAQARSQGGWTIDKPYRQWPMRRAWLVRFHDTAPNRAWRQTAARLIEQGDKLQRQFEGRMEGEELC